jgi:hypothetical protein
MRTAPVTVACLALGAFAQGCAPDASGDLGDNPDLTLADALWAEMGDYTTWAFPAGRTETPEQSADHSNNYVRIYFNDTLNEWDGTGSAPEGAVAVKPAYEDETGDAVKAFTVMQKVADYDPDNGDWFWANYQADGTVGSVGQLTGCAGCHAASTTDFLYSLPEPS